MTDFALQKEERAQTASAQQRKAANPEMSVWVEASAGTGKTKVLTDRVLRLLLNGVNPIRLLCLTYTKAAAVEMLSRISQKLSEWAVKDEDKLDKDLHNLLEEEIKSADDLRRYRQQARTLFAKLLDTPGGIKVQTLHSFCTDVLKRFPLEAGVSPYFSVLEDEEVQKALTQIKAGIARDDTSDNALFAAAREYLINNATENTFGSTIQKIIGNRRQMVKIMENHGGLDGFLAALSARLEIKDNDTQESLKTEFMDAVRVRIDEIKAIIEAWKHGSPSDVSKADKLQKILERGFIRQDYDDYKSCYFAKTTNTLNQGKNLATNGAKNFDHLLLDRLNFEGDLLQQTEQKLLRQKLYQSTKAAFILAEEINRRYEKYKQEQSCMDFDDLIFHTRNLLENSSSRQWVLYKLDGGIDHILLDEAQDTSPEQWDIIARLSEDFFSGDGQSNVNRTLFVVGDRKQSIFSFQGADPDKFDKMARDFKDKAEKAQKPFEKVDLDISFRSAPAIMDSVNKIFATDKAADGVVIENRKVEHKPYRVGQFAKVTIMPLMEPEESEKVHNEDEYMHTPMERVYKTALVTKMAEATAHRIRQLIDARAQTDKPLHYRDIMVLVRTRNDFVEEFIRACEKENVAVSGADKMVLSEQIAIQDLVSLGKFLLFPQDNLSLAEVLTSPLFSINGELLEDLCYGRQKNETLWDRMGHEPRCAEIYSQLVTLLNNLDYIRPFELFNFVLSKMEGRRKFISRMGQEVEDALDEFLNLSLDYEQHQIPSLQGFISWFEQSNRVIKRESDDQETDAVRLFTVHHSKGLQAPIVFLPDTGTVPKNAKENAFLQDNELGYYPLNASYYDEYCTALNQKKALKSAQEYHRLLYVALTRAEDELYIGAYGSRNADSWYELCRRAFDVDDVKRDVEIEEISQEFVAKEQKKKNVLTMGEFAFEPWIAANLEPEKALAKPYTPSKEDTDEEPDSASPLADNKKFYRRGTLIHRLLQFLPHNAGNQEEAVDIYLQKYATDFSAAECQQIKSEVIHLINNPEFAEIFGPCSRAEVPIMGAVADKIISAQIDRLVVLPDKIMIVDFKTNRPACKSVEQTPSVYLNQLNTYAELAARIYPHKPIETYILWTNETRLMRVA